VEKDVALKPGGSFTIAGYNFKYLDSKPVQGPNYEALQARVAVSKDGSLITTLFPQKRRYWVKETDMSQAAISVGWNRDLFVAMGDSLGNGAWSMRIQYKPLIRFVWMGALVMAIGGAVAATDRRYRSKLKSEAAQSVGAPPSNPPDFIPPQTDSA
jgi:cytochrome c-type biogenesis protein CcmF